MVQFGDDTYGEERAVKKLFRCVPKKYKQMARSIKSLGGDRSPQGRRHQQTTALLEAHHH
jgi:hypothetical protein